MLKVGSSVLLMSKRQSDKKIKDLKCSIVVIQSDVPQALEGEMREELIILQKGEDKDSELPKSYRSVCLLSNLGKFLERILSNKVLEHCDL